VQPIPDSAYPNAFQDLKSNTSVLGYNYNDTNNKVL